MGLPPQTPPEGLIRETRLGTRPSDSLLRFAAV